MANEEDLMAEEPTLGPGKKEARSEAQAGL